MQGIFLWGHSSSETVSEWPNTILSSFLGKERRCWSMGLPSINGNIMGNYICVKGSGEWCWQVNPRAPFWRMLPLVHSDTHIPWWSLGLAWWSDAAAWTVPPSPCHRTSLLCTSLHVFSYVSTNGPGRKKASSVPWLVRSWASPAIFLMQHQNSHLLEMALCHPWPRPCLNRVT